MTRIPPSTSKDFLELSLMMETKGYVLGPKIGSGSYSQVRLVERVLDGKILAVKIINRSSAAKDYVKLFLPRELEIIITLDHKNITKVEDIIHHHHFVFIIMEYADNGDLLDYVKSSGALSNSEARRMFKQLVMAVGYLHSNSIVHRDLKCENILMKRDGDILVSDFGFAKAVDGDQNKYSQTFCGSAAYASPQLLKGLPYEAKGNDVWGLGCILFIMLCGSMPYDDRNMKKMIQKQKEGISFPSKIAPKISDSCKQLLQNLLEPDQHKRYTVHEILNSPWLKEAES